VTNTLDRTTAGYLLTLIVVVSFAVYPSVAPLGLSAGATPLGFVSAAMLCSFMGVLILAKASGAKSLPAAREVPGRIVLGVIFFFEHACLLFALNYLAVPVAMSLIYTYPFMIGLADAATGRSRPSLSLYATLLLCLIGVSLVLGFSKEQLGFLGL
jgi:drug/metabolite transporter (DMT)-like permease